MVSFTLIKGNMMINNMSPLNPFNIEANKESIIKYNELSLNRKVATIALSIFATLVSLPLLGLVGFSLFGLCRIIF